MIGIDKPSIEALDLSEDGTYGKFVVEPLERGYGTTIGNSLQRQTEPAFGGARSGQKPRAVRLANHSATPSLDLEMSKRCGAKPRIL